MKRFTITILTLYLTTTTNFGFAQNLLNLNYWTIGTGSTGSFDKNGYDYENIREWGEGPGGKRVILWKAQPDGLGQADGGWNTNLIPVNHTSMYRFTVWMKKTNSKDGHSYLGCKNVMSLSGVLDDNPYFFYGSLPEIDKWYLIVGYVHGSGDNSLVNLGGIYDGDTGAKVVECPDFKFYPGVTNTYHRSYLYYDANANDRQYFYAPRVDVVNGEEPSVESLLGTTSSASSTAYFPGKVGIQTHEPGNYELAVNGEVRAKEVRVETGWSDFVFNKDYHLLSLEQVEAFINKIKHLPDVPSQEDVSKNGVLVGSINSKLLQKIEELTLHIIQMNKEIEKLKHQKVHSNKK